MICVKALSGHPLENENDPGSEVAMSISAVVGYIAILIALGFGVTATFSVVEKQSLLDRGRKKLGNARETLPARR